MYLGCLEASLNCLTLYSVSVLLWDHQLPRASSGLTLKVYPRVKGTPEGDRQGVFSGWRGKESAHHHLQ